MLTVEVEPRENINDVLSFLRLNNNLLQLL